MKSDVRRILTKFRRDNEAFEGEMDVSHIPVEVLIELFCPPPEDPYLYVSRLIEPKHALVINGYLSKPLDLNTYDYFLDAESKD